MKIHYIWLCLILMIPILSKAQYFGNNAFQVPIIGWMAFDTTAGFIHSAQTHPWQVTDQLHIGAGYQTAIMTGYKLWYTAQITVGFGYARNYSQPAYLIPIGVNFSTGLRYNFLDRWHRPFIHFKGEWFQLFNTGVSSGYAFWLGFLAGPGYEFIFANNMGIQLDTAAHVLFDFKLPARFSWTARLSYTLYF